MDLRYMHSLSEVFACRRVPTSGSSGGWGVIRQASDSSISKCFGCLQSEDELLRPGTEVAQIWRTCT